MGSGILKGVVFVMAMLAGMGLFERLERQRRPESPVPTSEKNPVDFIQEPTLFA